jgi:PKD repeat protein
MGSKKIKFQVFTLVLLFTFVFSYNDLNSQNDARLLNKTQSVLYSHFEDFNIINLNSAKYLNEVSQIGDFVRVTLSLGEYGDFDLELLSSDLLGSNYKLRSATSGLIDPDSYQRAIPMKGKIVDNPGSSVRLTFNNQFIYGYIKKGKEVIFIEPLSYFTNAVPSDNFVVYSSKDIKPETGKTCGLNEMQQKTDEFKLQNPTQEEKVDECIEIEMSIASDWLMYLDYNSNTTDVEDHNIAVMNDVQGNWDDEFADELIFVIVEQWISDCNTCDPWTNSTSASALLSSFTSWGPTGFDEVHDVGQLWTDRNFNGSTVGIAWLSSICTNNRYHCLQDYTTNANSLRVLTSHELGHNFSAPHDSPGSGFIMAPSVNNSNSWSSLSVTRINQHVASRSCLANCPIDNPPIALFESSDPNICAGETVHFTDTSLNDPETWDWTFDGGTPSSSTDQNPTVQYNVPGTYNVTLFITNPVGSDDTVAINHVTVTAVPIAAFSSENVTDQIVEFTNESSGGGSYLWNFGDGQSSTEENPQHYYIEDGVYTVTLTLINGCGTDVFISTVTIVTLPTADFVASDNEGCSPLEVFFFDLSSPNTTNWDWTFNGGTPISSNDQNPIVIYDTPGTYDVSLTVSNAAGEDSKTITQYITIFEDPFANFDYLVDGFTVDFEDLSSGAGEYFWDFGDNSSSNEANPSHTYAADGIYTVSLTIINQCGQNTFIVQVEISNNPSAGASANQTNGCIPFIVEFSDESSSNVDSWSWTFEGGQPSTSGEQNPEVVYSTQGTYDVELIVSNETGSDTLFLENYIIVGEGPNSGFSYNEDELDVQFDNGSTNSTNYSWDFGDNTSSTAQSPSHTYAEDGVYTVMLIATNSCGNDTTIQVLNVISLPVAGASSNQTEGCIPFVVQFNDQSSDNVNSWSWSFPGGIPSTSNEQNPLITYESAGLYSVELTVSNELGSDMISLIDYIEVGAPPSALFTFTKDQLVFDFTNQSTNANSYLWDFGDNQTSTEVNPSHEYAQDGAFTVTLTASNDCGDISYTFEVNASAIPTAGIGSNITEGCEPFEVQFMDLSSGNVETWSWTFEGGTPLNSSEENPLITYDVPGTYPVSLTVSNEAGSDEITIEDYIVVNTIPTSKFDFNINGNVVNFNNLSLNATSYLWTYGPGATSTLTSPAISFPQDGTYEVTLEAFNGCGFDEYTLTVEITAFPNAGVSSSTNIGCQPFEVSFFDNSTDDATSWKWEFPGGVPESSTEQNPVVSYSEPGFYNVSLEATNEVGSNSISLINYVEVKPLPKADYSYEVDKADIIFTNNSEEYDDVLWDFGDNITSDELNPTHTYTTSGDYTILLIASNICGSDTFEQTVTMDIRTPIIVFSQSVTEGCSPLSIQFVDQSDNNPLSWNWSFPGGSPSSSSDPNPLIEYSNAGSYDVSLELTNEFGSSFLTVEGAVTVLPLPSAGFEFTADQGDVLFTNMSTDGETYSWDFGDDSGSEMENPSHTYMATGSYEVKLIVGNDCGFDTLIQTLDIVLSSVFDENLYSVFELYPNPNDGRFSVEIEGIPSDKIEFIFIDLLGRKILKREDDFNSGVLRSYFDLNHLESGTYLLQVVQEGKSSIRKFVINK